MLAQLVKASVSQADVKRFEPHLGHNWLSCGVFFCTGTLAPSGTNHMAKLAVSPSGWLGRYTNVEYLQSLPEETRTITVPKSERVYFVLY